MFLLTKKGTNRRLNAQRPHVQSSLFYRRDYQIIRTEFFFNYCFMLKYLRVYIQKCVF